MIRITSSASSANTVYRTRDFSNTPMNTKRFGVDLVLEQQAWDRSVLWEGVSRGNRSARVDVRSETGLAEA
jgi:hypothetical protein